ncbi:DNA primase, catalytic core [Terriglobus roseus DSM 18391]|uniref:DNA primase n=1 Tax=Terriglobus roseus (strain DSM 18391 / NRRL B-41598 / KBS 63) TaxID=926566 RepID=I3ZM07_TERRK|nr:DNA primase [Terriglobus roseus]AFL90275.1 DNA primase, catalytic core [Terriglobus roseus DSM 18391]
MADNFAQTVKQATDIVKVIGEYVRLRKSGAQNFSGLCPFHQEKSPSFSVNVQHSYFYCFGCHAKGDVFTFVQKIENISFPEAVRAVAQKSGIPLPKREWNSPEEAAQAGLRRQLIDIHEAATQYFQQALQSPEAARAREYISSRAITSETIAQFRIGYAPDDFNHMRDALGKHFNDETMRASGLFSSKEQNDEGRPTGNMYSRFRKRITFPICNEAGKTIAFTARALDSDEKSGPKYMNSPETPLYTKGQVLFNLDKAKSAIRTQDYALLVEGQMDCIRVFTSGIQPVIATSGTAFTEHQVRLLGRFTKRVVVNFDPDTAGANAAEKSLALLTEAEFEVRIVTLDGGLDPDRFVQEKGIVAYADALKTAKPHAEYLVDRARALFPQRTAEAKVKAVNFLLPHIRRLPSAIQRTQFVDDAAQKLGIDSSLMRQELQHAATHRLESVRSTSAQQMHETERILLRALVLPETDKARQRAASELAAHPEWLEGMAAADLMEALAGAPVEGNPLDVAPDDRSRELLARLLSEDQVSDPSMMLVEVGNVLHTLERRRLERRQRELKSMLAEAERRGDESMIGKLQSESVQINRALRTL